MSGYAVKEASNRGIIQTPDLIMSGETNNDYWWTPKLVGEVATGVDECIASVRRLVRDGSDMIKITATGGSTGTSNTEGSFINLNGNEGHC